MHKVAKSVAKRRRRKLYNLEPSEVSLVDEGANLKQILVLKRKGPMNAAAAEQVTKDIASVDAAVISAADAVVDELGAEPIAKFAPAPPPMLGVRAPAPPPGQPPPRLQGAPPPTNGQVGGGLSEAAQAALKAVARILAPYADQITFSDLDALQESLGMVNDERDAGNPAPPAARGTVTQAIAKAKKKVKDDAGDGEDFGTDDAADEDDEEEDGAKAPKKGFKGMGEAKIKKSADGDESDEQRWETISKRAAALEEQNSELIAKSAKLAAELEIEREDRLTREYIAKAAAYKDLGDTDSIAQVLRSMHNAPEKERAQFEAVLKSATARVRAAAENGGSLYGELGSSQGASSGAATYEAKLEALVDGVVQKSAGAKTREQIYAETLQSPEGRALYRQSQIEKGFGAR